MINKCMFRNKWIQIGLFASKDVKIKPVFSDCVCVCVFFLLLNDSFNSSHSLYMYVQSR